MALVTLRISIDGCDDSTDFEIDLDESVVPVLELVALSSKTASTYGCQPTMTVRRVE